MLLQPSHRLVNSFSPLLFISCMFHCSQFTTCCSLYPTHDLHFTEQSFYFYLFLYPSTPVYKTIRFFFNVEETSNRGTGVNKRKLYIQINHILSTVLISGCIDWQAESAMDGVYIRIIAHNELANTKRHQGNSRAGLGNSSAGLGNSIAGSR